MSATLIHEAVSAVKAAEGSTDELLRDAAIATHNAIEDGATMRQLEAAAKAEGFANLSKTTFGRYNSLAKGLGVLVKDKDDDDVRPLSPTEARKIIGVVQVRGFDAAVKAASTEGADIAEIVKGLRSKKREASKSDSTEGAGKGKAKGKGTEGAKGGPKAITKSDGRQAILREMVRLERILRAQSTEWTVVEAGMAEDLWSSLAESLAPADAVLGEDEAAA